MKSGFTSSKIIGKPLYDTMHKLEYTIFHNDFQCVIHITSGKDTVSIRLNKDSSIQLAKAFQPILKWKENKKRSGRSK